MSRRILPASLLLLWVIAMVARPAILRRVAPVRSTFLTKSRTPLYDLYVRDDSATVAARTEFLYQRDRRGRAERIYTLGVVILGSVALLVVCAPLFRRIVLHAGRLHAGQVALIWFGAALVLAVLWLALPLGSTFDGITLSALLYPLAVLLAAASLVVPFALTWCWFSSRAPRP